MKGLALNSLLTTTEPHSFLARGRLLDGQAHPTRGSSASLSESPTTLSE